jgi:protein-L-isoaspartate(D-aspartate) O-methyltransferase
LSNIEYLLENLKLSGVPVDKNVELAFKSVKIEDFVFHSSEDFWQDKPVVFMTTKAGAVKNISAPHMIATLLHHLEIQSGLHFLLIGSKGGYLAAILDHILGVNGIVTIIEPHNEVLEYTRDILENYNSKGIIRVLSTSSMDYFEEFEKPIDRVLITGAMRENPEFLNMVLQDGAFILGPFGGTVQQRLLKREKNGDSWLDTDLGGVMFGPMDAVNAERNPLDPQVLAEGLEDSLVLISDIIEINETIYQSVEQLITSLRELPRDIPPISEDASEDEILEHPVMDLIMAEMEWLAPIWPIFGHLISMDFVSFVKSDEGDVSMAGGHKDLVP